MMRRALLSARSMFSIHSTCAIFAIGLRYAIGALCALALTSASLDAAAAALQTPRQAAEKQAQQQTQQQDSPQPALQQAPEHASQRALQRAPRQASAQAPLRAELERIARGVDGRVGACVADSGSMVCANGDQRYSLQSVMKLLVAIAAMDAADQGKWTRDDVIVVRKADLSLFVQPIAKLVTDAGYRTTVGDLARRAIVDSDSAAADILIARLGGTQAVQAVFDRHHLTGVRIDRDERHLQTEIGGIDWRPEFVDSARLDAALAAVPEAVKDAAYRRYQTDPRDTATAAGMTALLQALADGKLLSADSTRYLLDVMTQTVTFPDRLKAGVPDGWTLGHKTGSSGSWRGVTAATNDVGILTAPDGRRISVVVFIADSRGPSAGRASAMAAIARAAAKHHGAEHPAQSPGSSPAPPESAQPPAFASHQRAEPPAPSSQSSPAQAGGQPRAAADAPADLVIRHATIVDGSGAPAVVGDVLIQGGRIVRVGALGDRVVARETLEARGVVVAPGFIDVHTHADDVAETPLAENFVRMGVTSIVAGNCGSSAVDVAKELAQIRQTRTSLNFATLVGHNSVRAAVMGSARRAPSAAELAKMQELVRQAMVDGAVGFSTGLQYVPGTYAETPEIVELAKVSGAAGGIYASHMRNEGTAIDEAVAETIAVGEAARCPVEISHLKIDSPSRWGGAERVLGLIDAARARGVNVRADQYAYTAGSSGLGIRFPSWALEGGQAQIAQRLDDAQTWARIRLEMIDLLAARGFKDLSWAVVASYRPDASVNGLTMAQVAKKWRGSDDRDAQLETARVMMKAGGAQMVYHFMSDADVARIMKHPMVGFASDASVNTPGQGVPHPRGYGNNARVLGKYVREQHVISLEEAVRKMTSLPAEHFGFADRGLIKAGYAADLVIFDPATVDDPSTYDAPHAYAAGVPHVLVNGIFVVRDGKHTGARPGAVLVHAKRPATPGATPPAAAR
jgi:N-acyl-D-amino-acid deacylase